ncbi:MAG: hypothetical protein IIB08_04080 [Bacteroidetes bacterium]|nr:hypothetical protein [Bacteroidota bacterium]
MELQELKERFESAIGAFLNKEVDLLKNNINEETISTELTGYLREEFDAWQWNVDHLFDHRIKNNEYVRKRIILARDALPIDKIPKNIAEDEQEINKLIIPDNEMVSKTGRIKTDVQGFSPYYSGSIERASGNSKY